jgi:hypothetical protein
MKKIIGYALSLSLVAVLLVGCNSNNGVEPTASSSADNLYLPIMDDGGVGIQDTTVLPDSVKLGLQYMREEEKLARDVYLTFFEQYNEPIFGRISRAEQMHMNAVGRLLLRYGISDPVGDNGIGVFTNPDLQALYNTLIEQGNDSLVAALNVGGAIEEIDILDLLDQLPAVREYRPIARVYSALERGSEHHLRGFVSVLSNNGVTYEPQYLDEALYLRIITQNPGGGHGGHGGHGGGHGGHGGNGGGNRP